MNIHADRKFEAHGAAILISRNRSVGHNQPLFHKVVRFASFGGNLVDQNMEVGVCTVAALVAVLLDFNVQQRLLIQLVPQVSEIGINFQRDALLAVQAETYQCSLNTFIRPKASNQSKKSEMMGQISGVSSLR